jgi:hypothetical protein
MIFSLNWEYTYNWIINYYYYYFIGRFTSPRDHPWCWDYRTGLGTNIWENHLWIKPRIAFISVPRLPEKRAGIPRLRPNGLLGIPKKSPVPRFDLAISHLFSHFIH